MDDRRFDNWSKALAARGTRRKTLKRSTGAALLGFLGIQTRGRAQTSTGLSDDGTCQMRFEARVHTGPSSSGDSDLITGILSFQVGDGGLIDDGDLALGNGQHHAVTGQATGRFLSLNVNIDGDIVVLVGAGETNVRTCAGIYGGPTSGPQPGDLGAWNAIAGEPAASTSPENASTPGLRAFQGEGSDEPGLGDDGICRMEFETTVRFGPTLESENAPTIRGMLLLDIGENGGIGEETSVLELASGVRFPVVGQAPGQSIALRISLGDRVIVAVGVGNGITRHCAGSFSGRAVGPAEGDLGDWTALAGERNSTPNTPVSSSSSSSGESSSGSGSGSSGGEPTPTSTPCTLTQSDCSDLFLDLDQCLCICQETGEPICGERCCNSESICVDGATCTCPNGGVYCEGHCFGCPAGAVCQDERCICPPLSYYCDDNNTCVPCQEGRTFDPNNGCSCISNCPGAIGAVCNGVCVDLAIDPANCGTCGTTCATGQTCAGGVCACQAGWTLCGDTCRDLMNDRRNCGECVFQCGAFDSCIAGVCG